MKNKPRKQKLFHEKFPISSNSNHATESDLQGKLDFIFKKNQKTCNNQNLKEALVSLNAYEGSFYIEPDLVNFKALNLNLEDVYLHLSTLDKTKHKDKYWAYKTNQFQKVFVAKVFKETAIIVIVYNDSWTPLITQTIFLENLYLEGNLCKLILE